MKPQIEKQTLDSLEIITFWISSHICHRKYNIDGFLLSVASIKITYERICYYYNYNFPCTTTLNTSANMISVLSVAILIHLHVDIWLILTLKFEIQLEIFYREKFTDHADPSDVFLSFYQEHETILWLV